MLEHVLAQSKGRVPRWHSPPLLRNCEAQYHFQCNERTKCCLKPTYTRPIDLGSIRSSDCVCRLAVCCRHPWRGQLEALLHLHLEYPHQQPGGGWVLRSIFGTHPPRRGCLHPSPTARVGAVSGALDSPPLGIPGSANIYYCPLMRRGIQPLVR